MELQSIFVAIAGSTALSGVLVYIVKRMTDATIDLRLSRAKEEWAQQLRRGGQLHDDQRKVLTELAAANIKARDHSNEAVLAAEKGRRFPDYPKAKRNRHRETDSFPKCRPGRLTPILCWNCRYIRLHRFLRK